jgi:hypothetical protein
VLVLKQYVKGFATTPALAVLSVAVTAAAKAAPVPASN